MSRRKEALTKALELTQIRVIRVKVFLLFGCFVVKPFFILPGFFTFFVCICK